MDWRCWLLYVIICYYPFCWSQCLFSVIMFPIEHRTTPNRLDLNLEFPKIYPLVNIHKTMENQHLEQVNQRFLWPFSIASIAMLVYQRVSIFWTWIWPKVSRQLFLTRHCRALCFQPFCDKPHHPDPRDYSCYGYITLYDIFSSFSGWSLLQSYTMYKAEVYTYTPSRKLYHIAIEKHGFEKPNHPFSIAKLC